MDRRVKLVRFREPFLALPSGAVLACLVADLLRFVWTPRRARAQTRVRVGNTGSETGR
jgi:hypothetical protein